jgi:hypothetical protein
VRTVALSWQVSYLVAAGLAILGIIGARIPNRHVQNLAAFVREAATLFALYGTWRLAGRLSVDDTGDAYARALALNDIQEALHFPGQAAMQTPFLGWPLFIQATNLYYATMHFTMMFVFLIWLFWRHRDRYRPIRQVMAWSTLACLLIALIPVAPPRFFPELGIVDTAELYGQSVYANGFAADQLSAMPSVHVLWAVVIGYYTWRVSPSRWRWIGPLHMVLTIFAVVVTGNHWWLDGVAAAAVLVAVAWIAHGVRRVLGSRLLVRHETSPEAAPRDTVEARTIPSKGDAS